MNAVRVGVVAACALATLACQRERSVQPQVESSTVRATRPAPKLPELPLGVAAGDPRPDRITLWTRATSSDAHVNFLVEHRGDQQLVSVRPNPKRDHVAKVTVQGLEAGTEYRYRTWLSHEPARRAEFPPKRAIDGRFRTLPEPTAPAPLRLAWGGDVGGQNVCRHRDEGFPLFEHLRQERPDVFIGLGDLVYADNECKAQGAYGQPQVAGVGPARSRAEYWAHWRYVREDAALQRFLASVSLIGIWDDHEVVNDFGPHNDVRSYVPYDGQTHLLPVGRQALWDYLPLEEPKGAPSAKPTLYRHFAWGRDVELIVLDTRSYRDANDAKDTKSHPKTMLGEKQRKWFAERLTSSAAKWKLVVCSVPMSIPTGHSGERDGWANHDTETGYEHELIDILSRARDARVRNIVFLTTDVHFASVFAYTPFPSHPDFVVHEIVTGPLNAGLFGHQEYDETLNPKRLFFYGSDSKTPVTSWGDAKRWFNFGIIEVDTRAHLRATIRNGLGKAVYSLDLEGQSD